MLIVALCATMGEAVIAALLAVADWWLVDRVSAWSVVAGLACAAAATACIAAIVSPRRQRAALVATFVAQVVVAAFLVVHGASLWAALGQGAFDGPHAVVTAAALSACAVTAFGVAWYLPRPARTAACAIAALTVAGGVLGAAGAVAVEARGMECDRFRFDPERWATAGSGRESIAEALVECGVLGAGTRHAVRERLGRPDLAGRDQDLWTVGDPDAWIPAVLTVDYTRAGRVIGLRLNGD